MSDAQRTVVLTRHPDAHGVRRLLESAESLGTELHLVDPHELVLASTVSQSGSPATATHPRLGGTWTQTAVIPRLGSLATEYSLAALHVLELCGAGVLNHFTGLTRLRNKFSALMELSASGLPVPETVMLRAPSDFAGAVEQLGGYPVVIKFIRGSQGIGVIIAPDAATVVSVVEAMNLVQYDVLLQRYYPAARDTDIRVLVLDGEPRWVVRRRAEPGGFRSNFHRGGTAAALELTAEIAALACNAAACFDLGLAGVDLIEDNGRLLVLEVNASPGFQTIEEAFHVDAAAAIISAAQARVG